MKTQIVHDEAALAKIIELAKFKGDETKIAQYISENLSGTDNRFLRQEIMKVLTGQTIPLVKCGLSHLKDAFMAAQKKAAETIAEADRRQGKTEAQPESVIIDETKKPKKEEQPIDFDAIVGRSVLRKKCKRKGVIKSHTDGKLVIELEDGSVRKPAAKRFNGLYNLVNPEA